MRHIKKILLLIAVVTVGYYAWTRFMPQGAGRPPGGAPPVGVAEVTLRDVRLWHEFSGRLTAVDQVEVRPQVGGIIEKVHFADGAMVKKGDVLFTIDPRPYQAALEAANAHATLANSELERAQSLLKDKALAQRDYDQRRNDAESAKADLTRARLNLDYTKVISPISGRAGRVEITAGNLVETGANAPVLTTVVSSSPIYADFEIDEAAYLQYAASKATANKDTARIPVMMGLATEEGAPHKGHIESFDNRLNNASGTIRVRAVFDNEDGTLVPGLFARVRLGGAEDMHALLITDRAVGTDQNKKFVLVVGDGNKVDHREVQLGPLADGLRVVREGLKPGEKIIVSGMQRVMMPGQEVAPELVQMDEQMSDVRGQMSDKKQEEKK